MKYKRLINIILQTIAFFTFVLALFFLMELLGITPDIPILPGAIGSTVGWTIARIFHIEKRLRKD